MVLSRHGHNEVIFEAGSELGEPIEALVSAEDGNLGEGVGFEV